MTVMMLVVVVLLFNGIITQGSTGTQAQIQKQGTAANTKIGALAPQ